MRRKRKPPKRQNGFTLLELLVAMSVLAIVVVLMAQMIGSTSLITSSGTKRMAADEEARMVLDRMAADIARMVKREDVDSLFLSQADNDAMYFYTEGPAVYTGPGKLALVGYRMDTNGLWRDSHVKSWDDVAFVTVGTNGVTNSTSLIDPNSATSQQPFAPGVFRMQYSLLMKPGTPNVSGQINATNTYSKTNLPGAGLKDVSAVVVTLALIDEISRENVDPASIAPFFPTMNGPAAENWSEAVNTIEPPHARTAIRIYQRYIPVSP
jgi:prepilin-type N-terminal cleavage/methylation domain-containing protein